MRTLKIVMHGVGAGRLTHLGGDAYEFEYFPDYDGPPVSLSMPLSEKRFRFEGFPAVFDGLLPEGIMLEALLRRRKLDRGDYMNQLASVGGDLTGAITVLEDE